jgi:tRNA 2-selenouridine synthase SelU
MQNYHQHLLQGLRLPLLSGLSNKINLKHRSLRIGGILFFELFKVFNKHQEFLSVYICHDFEFRFCRAINDFFKRTSAVDFFGPSVRYAFSGG